MADYFEVTVTSEAEFAFDILTACLAEIGFDSFETDDISLKAYINEDLYDAEVLEATCRQYQALFPFNYSVQKIISQNWNALWESGFQPVVIAGKLRIRAAFHQPDSTYPYEIVIQPKMSFGTGHHATTHQVMEMMLDQDIRNKRVLDFGSGTGILAILANKMGAIDVWAVDNDAQCIENAGENFNANNCKSVHLVLGGIQAIAEDNFDIIIANITRNTILENFELINLKLQPGGLLITSGFYEEDIPVLNETARAKGLGFIKKKSMDKWCCAVYQKDKMI